MKKKGTQQQNTSSAQDYRKEAKLHMAAIKSSWVIFAKTGVVVMAAAVVIFVATVAWFANNREVQANNMAIQMAGSPYELAVLKSDGTVTGVRGKWNLADQELLPDGQEFTFEDTSITYYTTENKSSICWSVNPNSHVDNLEGYNASGLEPGARGSLTFYILPKVTGESLKVKLRFDVIGHMEDGTPISDAVEKGVNLTGVSINDEELKDVSEAQKLLKGHILLFAGYNQTNATYEKWISEDANAWNLSSEEDKVSLTLQSDGSLLWSAEEVQQKAYPITIYWIWPEEFGQYVMYDSSQINKNPVLFGGTDASSGIPSGLFSKLCEAPADAISNAYLKWSRRTDVVAEKTSARGEFGNLMKSDTLLKLRQEGKADFLTYSKMCYYYNMADQFIGEKVYYASIRVEAE